MSKKKIEVVAAIIFNNLEILCVQRPYNKYDYISYKYEFPGGKIEENETEEKALKREIQEELSLEISVSLLILPEVGKGTGDRRRSEK